MTALLLAMQLLDPAAIARLHEERIARQPESKAAKRDLGLFWLRNGRFAEAERWLRAAAAEPIFLAEAVAAQGRDEEAARLFETCAENARCLTRLAQLAEKNGDAVKALRFYQQARDADPTPGRRNDYAQALQQAKRFPEAEREFRAALADAGLRHGSNHPETGTTLNNLAMLLAETNRVRLAVPLQRRAVTILEGALGPDHPRVRIARENLKDMLP